MKNKPLNHPRLGGNVVDLRNKMPQRKPEKLMTGEELLKKAVYGTHKPRDTRGDIAKL